MPEIKNINHLHSLQMGDMCLCWSMPSTISWAVCNFAYTFACTESNCEPQVRDQGLPGIFFLALASSGHSYDTPDSQKYIVALESSFPPKHLILYLSCHAFWFVCDLFQLLSFRPQWLIPLALNISDKHFAVKCLFPGRVQKNKGVL